MKKQLLLPLILIAISVTGIIFFYKENFIVPNNSEVNFDEHEEGFTNADKQMNMWFWSRAYPDPYNLDEKYMQAWVQAEAIRGNIASKGGNTYGGWVSLGPDKTIGGRILTIAINPKHSDTIFIGSASGGIWQSTTAGEGTNAWKRVKTNLPVLGVASIIINPNNTNEIYAGTGEVYRVDTTGIGFNVWKTRGTYGVGIIKSNDGGKTWAQVLTKNNAEMFAIQMLQFDPVNSNSVYACATDGLYRSDNSGSTWNKILDKIYVSDVAIDPANTNILVASVGNLVNADKGLYRSTNGGASWAKITAVVPSSFAGLIRMDNAGATRLYASFANGTSADELYLSTDFGATWIAKSSSAHSSYQFWYANDVAVDPSNINRVLMCGVSMYSYTSTSTTTGAGTRSSIGGNIHSDIHDIAYDPLNNNIVYVTCDGGIYKSTNNGSSFSQENNGLDAVQFYASFGVSPIDSNAMLGGLQDNGSVKYDGTSWKFVNGGDGGPTVYNPQNANIVFNSIDARNVYRSTNGGNSFSSVLGGWSDDRTGFMAPLAISTSDPNYVYCASDNWHASKDGGKTWSNSSESSTSYIEARFKTGVAIGVSPVNSQKIFVSTSPFSQKTNNDLHVNPPPNLFKSTNAGAASPTFTNVKNNLPDRFVMDFAFSKTNDDSMFIALGGFGTPHIYVTANGGGSWTSAGSGLPDVPFNAVLLDPVNPQVLYAGCDLGVYVSPDRGQTWYDFNKGFWDATLVMDLQISADKKLIAATHGKGVFKSPLFSGIILPVTLTAFTGENKNGMNELNWKSANETNFSYYDIERSTDSMLFSSIGKVNGTGTAATYHYTDDISKAAANDFYYRLKMVDKDGRFSFSNIVHLRTVFAKALEIFPNPFVDKITIRFPSATNANIQVSLFDINGEILRKESAGLNAGGNIYELKNLSALPKGMYVLQLNIDGEMVKRKVVKE